MVRGQRELQLSAFNLDSRRKGKVVALVGENGAGKSTLVKLICRFYDPESGEISFNGVDLKNMNPISWRKKLSVIFQDFTKYNLTAEENIRVGDIDKGIDGEGIIRAAKQSGADPVLNKLPKGYNSQLGRMFEEGQELSVGEWQKVAIARAFYRNSDIIVLDEPSSSLDPLSEAELFKQFKKLIKGKTAILISHRFSTVKMADKIFVMKGKKIIEQGSHEELIKEKGFYYKMYSSRAKNYEKC